MVVVAAAVAGVVWGRDCLCRCAESGVSALDLCVAAERPRPARSTHALGLASWCVRRVDDEEDDEVEEVEVDVEQVAGRSSQMQMWPASRTRSRTATKRKPKMMTACSEHRAPSTRTSTSTSTSRWGEAGGAKVAVRKERRALRGASSS